MTGKNNIKDVDIGGGREATFLFSENNTGAAPRQRTEFSISISNDALCLRFDAETDCITSEYTKYNEPLYHQDVCELFLCADGNPGRYFEYEFSPHGVLFAAVIDNDLQGSVKIKLMERSAAKVQTEKTERGYVVQVQIPLSELGLKAGGSATFNAFRIDLAKSGEQRLYALSPTLINCFHVPSAFVKLNL